MSSLKELRAEALGVARAAVILIDRDESNARILSALERALDRFEAAQDRVINGVEDADGNPIPPSVTTNLLLRPGAWRNLGESSCPDA